MRDVKLTLDKIKNGLDGDYVSGLVLLGAYSKQPTKNNQSYFMDGSLEAEGSLRFKAWSSSSAYAKLESQDYQNTVVLITAKINDYSGVRGLILDSFEVWDLSKALPDGSRVKKSDFIQTVYDAEKYFNNLNNIIDKYCSEQAQAVFNLLMADDTVKERFTVEFAARAHHDNVKSGLLAHSLKVTKLATLLTMYPHIMKKISPDLLFLGCAIHDIGKVFEYTDGTIVNEGTLLSHNSFGVLILAEYSSQIIDLVGQEFYYRLLAVVEQHHGDYGDRPRTVASYVINQLDALEALLTSLNSALELTGDAPQVVFDGLKLA